MARQASIAKSPVKKSSKVSKGQIQLSIDQKTYIKRFKVGDTDPGLLINWFDDKIKAMLRKLSGGKIPNMPTAPAYINVQNMKQFKESVHLHLHDVCGGSFGCFIAPNTGQQFGNVVTRLRDVEVDPFMQALVASVGGPIAECGRIINKNSDPVPCTRIAPPAPLIQVFA